MTYGADIPRTYTTPLPSGFSEGAATYKELQAAGFHQEASIEERKPGQQPLDEMVVEGPQTITPEIAAQLLREGTYHVLRDRDGLIVATWDEGRWWTPAESAQFDAHLAAELAAE